MALTASWARMQVVTRRSERGAARTIHGSLPTVFCSADCSPRRLRACSERGRGAGLASSLRSVGNLIRKLRFVDLTAWAGPMVLRWERAAGSSRVSRVRGSEPTRRPIEEAIRIIVVTRGGSERRGGPEAVTRARHPWPPPAAPARASALPKDTTPPHSVSLQPAEVFHVWGICKVPLKVRCMRHTPHLPSWAVSRAVSLAHDTAHGQGGCAILIHHYHPRACRGEDTHPCWTTPRWLTTPRPRVLSVICRESVHRRVCLHVGVTSNVHAQPTCAASAVKFAAQTPSYP